MVQEISEISDVRLLDYIYLLRIMKFSKTGLIQLFKNPGVNIQQFKTMDTKSLAKILISEKKKSLDGYQNISNIIKFDYTDKDYIELKKMVQFCTSNDIKILTGLDSKIPLLFAKLKATSRDLIFVKGQILDSDVKSYSICGSRSPTEDAKVKTRLIAEYMAKKGFTLINGFARGIDIEAYLGSTTGKGRYIGVLGSGIENIYPPENSKYVSSIIKNGALISQKLIWNRVDEISLQIRNRFSAQLTLGSIFIEGNFKSGTIWQYKFAREMNIPTFYLEPIDWNHENAHILKTVRDNGGFEIKNDLSNLENVSKILQTVYENQMKELTNNRKHPQHQYRKQSCPQTLE